MNARIPLCVPSVGEAEEAAVLEALRSGWVAPAGPSLDAFEERLAALTGRSSVVAVSSGTAALHLSLLVSGIGEGDRVLVPTLTFAATANAVSYTGAIPVFVDCDAHGLLDPVLVAEALAAGVRTGDPVRAVIAVDVYGRPADYPRLAALCAEYGVPLVSDAAESLGAHGGDGTSAGPAGSFGDIAALSFNGNKIVTTSSGGAVLCPDERTADRVRHLATQARQPVAHYEHHEVGYNYRLSNLLAALGLAQLDRLEEILVAKREHFAAYAAGLAGRTGLRMLEPGTGNHWLSVVLVDPGSGTSAAELGADLAAAGIETRPVFKPMHLQPVHRGTPRDFITGMAEELFTTGLTLPSSTDLDAHDRARVIETLASAHEVRTTSGARTTGVTRADTRTTRVRSTR